MTRAVVGYENPKRISRGYLYHWWMLDGSCDRTFTDPNLLSFEEQKARFKKLRKESSAASNAIQYLRRIEPEDALRQRLINIDPELKDDPEFWSKSYSQLLYEEEEKY